MNTKNIFRTLFMAVLLLVGANGAKGNTTLYDNEAGSGSYGTVNIPFGALDDYYGDVLRITYDILPQSGWTPTYVIQIGNVTRATVTESGTYEIALDDNFFGKVNTTDKDNNCTWITPEWVTIYKVEIVSAMAGFPIKVSTNGHGSVEADKDSAEEGEDVTLTITPDQGYELGSISAVDANGENIELSGEGETYTFAMPGNKVTVNAWFKRIIELEEDEVSIWDGISPVAEWVNNEYQLLLTDTEWLSDARAGTKIRVYADRENDDWALCVANGNWNWAGFVSGNDTQNRYNDQCYDSDGGYFEFVFNEETASTIMNGGGFAISFQNLSIYEITYIKGGYSITINDILNGSVTADPTSAKEGKTVTLTITPADGYELHTVSIVDDNDNDIELSGEGDTRTFEMPASNVTVFAEFKLKHIIQEDENIVWEGYANTGTIEIGKEEFSAINVGSKVRVYLATFPNGYWRYDIEKENFWSNWSGESGWGVGAQTSNTCNNFENGYFEFEVSTDGAAYLKENGLKIAGITNIAIAYVTIILGEAPVEPTAYNITINEIPDGGTVTADLLQAKAGDTVTLTVTPAEGYELDVLEVKADDDTVVEVIDNQFIMPESDVTVSATFVKIVYSISGFENITGTITADPASATMGEIVTLTVTPADGYELEWLKVVDADGTEITVTDNTFTMPASNVTIEAEFKAVVETYILTIVIDGETMTQEVVAGINVTDILQALIPEKEGYTFAGWDGLPEDGLMPAEALTVTAQFTINSYTLTYEVDGETYGEVETYEYGAPIEPRTAPTKEGYTFSGWSEIPSYMPAYDVTVTGRFIKDAEYEDVTISSTGYATFCSTRDLDFSNTTVKAYIATAVSDTEVTFTQVAGSVAAKTGLLLIGEPSRTAQILVAETGTTYDNNLLVGVWAKDEIVNGTDKYVLVARTSSEVGVKFADTAAQPANVPVGKAYLQAPSNSRILTFSFADGTTGISAATTDENQTSGIYNLKGMRVTTPGKGLYIINGKKVMIK